MDSAELTILENWISFNFVIFSYESFVEEYFFYKYQSILKDQRTFFEFPLYLC